MYTIGFFQLATKFLSYQAKSPLANKTCKIAVCVITLTVCKVKPLFHVAVCVPTDRMCPSVCLGDQCYWNTNLTNHWGRYQITRADRQITWANNLTVDQFTGSDCQIPPGQITKSPGQIIRSDFQITRWDYQITKEDHQIPRSDHQLTRSN